MPSARDRAVELQRQRVAADYARHGYSVMRPKSSEGLPSFLHGHRPDLIAESAEERVIIEVKTAHSLKGSNELAELALRIAGEPGWRFELVAVASEGDEAAAVRNPQWLESMLSRQFTQGQEKLKDLYLVGVLSFLIRGLAELSRVKVSEKSDPRIARELAFRGVISQEVLDRVEAALTWRNMLMHSRLDGLPSENRAAEISQLCREVMRAAREPA